MINLGNDRALNLLNSKHDNFQVMGHDSGVGELWLWSHHEKLVVIDQIVAFVGGMDLCIGRFDDENYRLFDDDQSSAYWPHKDYNNSLKNTFTDPENYWQDAINFQDQ